METDLIKIKKISQEREDENWYFRTFLKGYDIKHLDSIVHELFKQVSEAIDCTSCGNCCKKMQPILKKKDIDKLSVSLNITPDKFKAKYVNKDGNGKSIINQLPCPFLKDNICTQYDSRPVDCASYPHLHKKDFVFRLIGVVNNYEICPIVFNVYEAGNPGDVKPVGEGVSELRINYGPDYRVYYKKQGQKVVILLAGGDKSTQTRDIKAALRLSRNL